MSPPLPGPALQEKITRFAALNIAVAAAVMGIKYIAYLASGSVALYSDALESIVNVMTAIAALIAVRIATIPADEDHPFGHHKAEFFAAIFEGAVLIVAALLILAKSYEALRLGPALQQAGRALFIEFHLVVPGAMTVDAAHAICDRLENAIEFEIEGSEAVIHVEPGYKAKSDVQGTVSL